MTSDELGLVLNRRGGSTLSRRSILKRHRPDTSRPKALNVDGVLDIRQARNLPIYTLGQCSVQVVFLLFQDSPRLTDGLIFYLEVQRLRSCVFVAALCSVSFCNFVCLERIADFHRSWLNRLLV